MIFIHKNFNININIIPVHTLKAYGDSGGLAPFFLNLGAKCRFTVVKAPSALVIVKYEDR
jgi:hypothetical protein